MRIVERTYIVCLLVAIALPFGCARPAAEAVDDGRLQAFAGIPPTAYLVERIGDGRVAVDVLIQAGQDPHTFDPTPRQVARLSRTVLFFKIGMPFENVLLENFRRTAPQMQIIDVAAGVPKRSVDGGYDEHAHGEHSRHDKHGEHGEHCASGGSPDPHVWLSPPLLKTQAKNIAAALTEVDPSRADEYRLNLATLLDEIEEVHRRIERRLAPHRGRSFCVFHPGFGYFADAYGLHEEEIEAGGRQPTPQQLEKLIERARAAKVKMVFVQPQFDPSSARAVAHALGGRVAPIDGLKKDVLSNLEDIASSLARSFEGEASGPRDTVE